MSIFTPFAYRNTPSQASLSVRYLVIAGGGGGGSDGGGGGDDSAGGQGGSM